MVVSPTSLQGGASVPSSLNRNQPRGGVRPGGASVASDGAAPGGEAPGQAMQQEEKDDEYKSPLTAMLKQVHSLLQKTGKGLPGFTQPPPSQQAMQGGQTSMQA